MIDKTKARRTVHAWSDVGPERRQDQQYGFILALISTGILTEGEAEDLMQEVREDNMRRYSNI